MSAYVVVANSIRHGSCAPEVIALTDDARTEEEPKPKPEGETKYEFEARM